MTAVDIVRLTITTVLIYGVSGEMQTPFLFSSYQVVTQSARDAPG